MSINTDSECGLCGQCFRTFNDFDAHYCQFALRKVEADIAKKLKPPT